MIPTALGSQDLTWRRPPSRGLQVLIKSRVSSVKKPVQYSSPGALAAGGVHGTAGHGADLQCLLPRYNCIFLSLMLC